MPAATGAVNAHTLTWTNAVTGIDQTGATVPFDPSNISNLEIQFDGGAVVEIPYPGTPGPTGLLDMSVLPAYKALKPGQHTVDIAVKSKDQGVIGKFSANATFQLGVVADAPTLVAVS